MYCNAKSIPELFKKFIRRTKDYKLRDAKERKNLKRERCARRAIIRRLIGTCN